MRGKIWREWGESGSIGIRVMEWDIVDERAEKANSLAGGKRLLLDIVVWLYDDDFFETRSIWLLSPLDYGPEQSRIQYVVGHSLVRSLVCSHCSLVCLLHTARFARSLCCAHSFACWLVRSLTPSRARGKVNDWLAVFLGSFPGSGP